MDLPDFQKLVLFITGPTYIRPEVKEAAMLPEFGHRDSENQKRFESIFGNLRKIAEVGDDYKIAIMPGSGSNAMETSIRSLVSNYEKVLNVSVGAFGDLYHQIAKSSGKIAYQLKFQPGDPIDLDKLESHIKQIEPAVVTLTHNETSTGVRNDIVSCCEIIRDNNAMPLVDGVSIFGGAPSHIENAKAAMYSTSTQKGLGLDAGFGIGIISKEALEKAKKVDNRGYTTDILQHVSSNDKCQILTTPNCSLANQMYVQLEYIVNEEGLQNRFDRHNEMKLMVKNWVGSLQDGFELFAKERYRSPTLTAVRLPESLKSKGLKSVKEEMRKAGYLFDAGYRKINQKFEEQGKGLTMRIGHMGDITHEMLMTYLQKLQEALYKNM